MAYVRGLTGQGACERRADSLKSVKDVPVSGWVPVRLVALGASWAWQQALLVDTGIARLVEGKDLDIVVLVFLNDTCGVFVRVERIHEDEGDVDVVSRVEVL